MIRRNILLVVGLLALLAGSALSFLWLADQRGTRAAAEPQPAQVSVLAAAHPIAMGTLLRPDDMTWIRVAATAVPPNDIVQGGGKENDFVGALARRDFQADEPLVASGLVRKTERSFLSAVLAPGDRAITITADASQTASGLVMPGDHVDIVLTQSIGDRGAVADNRTVSAVVLKDVRVVAIDQSLGQTASTAASGNTFAQTAQTPRTVTLELTEHDAERLLVAAQLGKIDLAVRALETDRDPPAARVIPPVWADEVSPAVAHPVPVAPASAVPTPSAPARAPAKPASIEVMHGGKIELR